jgi:hypothetical protein
VTTADRIVPRRFVGTSRDGTWFAPVPLRYERTYLQTVWVYAYDDSDHARVCVYVNRTRPGSVTSEELGHACTVPTGAPLVQTLEFRVDTPVTAWQGVYLEAQLQTGVGGGGNPYLAGVTIEYREITD